MSGKAFPLLPAHGRLREAWERIPGSPRVGPGPNSMNSLSRSGSLPSAPLSLADPLRVAPVGLHR